MPFRYVEYHIPNLALSQLIGSTVGGIRMVDESVQYSLNHKGQDQHINLYRKK